MMFYSIAMFKYKCWIVFNKWSTMPYHIANQLRKVITKSAQTLPIFVIIVTEDLSLLSWCCIFYVLFIFSIFFSFSLCIWQAWCKILKLAPVLNNHWCMVIWCRRVICDTFKSYSRPEIMKTYLDSLMIICRPDRQRLIRYLGVMHVSLIYDDIYDFQLACWMWASTNTASSLCSSPLFSNIAISIIRGRTSIHVNAQRQSDRNRWSSFGTGLLSATWKYLCFPIY